MEQYLPDCKQNLKNLDESTKVQAVLGNEACDLDSAVSSLVLAYFLYKSVKGQELIVPVLNVKRGELPLRTEIVFFLEEAQISVNDLICIDEIDLQLLAEEKRLSVVLVDHNALSFKQSFLEPHVVRIIDHHSVPNPERLKSLKVKIESVGSCCSLISEEVFNDSAFVIDPQIAMLLYGTILLDTVCLEEKAKRVSDKDRQMVSKLEVYLEGISRNEVFDALQKAKFDASTLSSKQLLQKDTKFISYESISVAIASLPVLMEDCLEDPLMISALHEVLVEENLIAIVLLGSKMNKDKSISRQLAIFSRRPDFSKKISKHLIDLRNPSLDLSPLHCKNSSVLLFNQENSSLTRKFVLPSIEMFLKSGNFTDNQQTEQYGFKKKLPDSIPNGLSEADSLDEQLSSYQAETLDFPNSPNHTSLLGMSLQLEDEHSSFVFECTNDNQSKDLSLCAELASIEGTNTLKKRISVHPDMLKSEAIDDDQKSLSSLSNKSDLDVFSPTDDIILPDDVDDLETSDFMESSASEPIPEMSAAEEFEEERSWKLCVVKGEERKIDMKVIEPYRKVLSHGGYQGSTRNAIIVFSACYLPDRSRKDYEYVMDNLFLYVITTLDQLVAEDYVLVYLHGATERSSMPSFGWLKRCYQMIDRRLRKNLKGLYLVHPTFWLKTIVIMTRPFISSKFSQKLKFVYSLEELASLIPLDQVSIPDKVKQLDFEKRMREKKKEKRGKKSYRAPIYYMPPIEAFY